ncbi:MAG: hypothetical protein LUD69_09110 [Oscillospiraceae bacterium]|nr:hypothetical protein [Oscillospiraceae bacterium]
MAAYTYDDFTKKLDELGYQLSDADLALAQSNPDAGMSILQYKQDYVNATTDEARALAHAGAEAIRSSYGNYSGGGDGSEYYLEALNPSSFSYEDAPEYTSRYDSAAQSTLEQMLNRQEYSYNGQTPSYTNQYQDTASDLLEQILSQEDFSYDPDSDELYAQYKKQYAREGQRAAADALGTAAAASGGIPSSYAATAAAQAGNYYASQLTDKIPELYQLAYSQYQDEYDKLLSNLSTVQSAEQLDYEKYLDQLSQYNTDRDFDYQTYLNRYSQLQSSLEAIQGLEDADYQKYLDQLSQYNTDRDFSYSQLLDEIDNQTAQRGEAVSNALTAAQYGDYSQLEALGIDTGAYQSNENYQKAVEAAQIAAEYGDYSLLESVLNMDASNNSEDWQRQYQLAALAAEYGDYSGLEALGIDTSAYQAAQQSGGSASGIVSTMKSLGDDARAYEYLVSLGYSSSITAQLWSLYQAAG